MAEQPNRPVKEFRTRGNIRASVWANEVEKVHGDLYNGAVKALEAGEAFPEKDYYICPKCGYTVGDEAPDKCPVCGAKKEEFFVAD